MTAQYKKILVPLDGSAFAAQALPHALALALQAKAELILFRVVPDASSLSQILEQSRNIMHIDDRQEHFVDDALAALEALAEELRLQDFKVTPVVQSGGPAAKIIDYAQEKAVDLIVMSSHGRSGLNRWVFGSVAEKVLRGADCSIFLVRAEH